MVDTAPLARILARVRDAEVFDALTGRLSGADLTTLLLAVARTRASRLRAPDVLRRYRSDRFVPPAAVPFHRLRAVEDAVLAAVPESVEMLSLSPVVPLGTHSVLSTVDQNRVVTTVRASEVAADPTNALALEAALRRERGPDREGPECVRLGAIQRVLRAQRFPPPHQSHFSLLGLVTAGRDTGSLAFERRHAVEHLEALVSATQRVCGGPVRVALSTLESPYEAVAERVRSALVSAVEVVDDPGRAGGYYTGLCFKVYTLRTGEPYEVADGGLVDWTQRLLGNRKERLLTSGLGLDRLATATAAAPAASAPATAAPPEEPSRGEGLSTAAEEWGP